MAPHLVQFELPWRDQRMWQRHLQSGIIDYVYNNSCVSCFDKSSWERPNGDHAVTLSALCNVFLPAPQNQWWLHTGTRRSHTSMNHPQRVRRAFGWSQSITKEPKRDVSSEIQQWVILIVDELNSRCSPFQIMQRIPFKSPVSSANVTAVKSCFVMSGHPLRVSVFFLPEAVGAESPRRSFGLKNKTPFGSAAPLCCYHGLGYLV